MLWIHHRLVFFPYLRLLNQLSKEKQIGEFFLIRITVLEMHLNFIFYNHTESYLFADSHTLLFECGNVINVKSTNEEKAIPKAKIIKTAVTPKDLPKTLQIVFRIFFFHLLIWMIVFMCKYFCVCVCIFDSLLFLAFTANTTSFQKPKNRKVNNVFKFMFGCMWWFLGGECAKCAAKSFVF